MKTADEIYREMCTNYAELTGVTVRDGCDMAVRLYAAAAQIESLYIYNDWVKAQCFPQTASGEYLDRHAEMRGLKRFEAVCAEGIIKFSTITPVEQELTVPEGTVCITASGVRFVTTESKVIAIGETSCECTAVAIENGADGNVEANTIVYMQQPPLGVSLCVNEYAFVGGTYEEDDESLRKRILATYSNLPSGANAAYYEKLALSINGVAAVKVIPKNRGLGTIDVIISGTDGMPNDEIIARVREKLNAAREICVDIQVYSPTAVTVDVQIGLDTEDKYSFDTVSENVRKALDDYFDGKLLGCDVLKAKLGNIIYGIEGVRNYSLILPNSDLLVGDTELPVMGMITVNALN